MLSNLLRNAVKYTNPGGRISLAAERHAAAVTLRVSDTGRGIEPEFKERIFDMFHTIVHPGSRKGTGIGLAIVRKIAELHGGRAFLESPPDGGSAFHVVLPRG